MLSSWFSSSCKASTALWSCKASTNDHPRPLLLLRISPSHIFRCRIYFSSCQGKEILIWLIVLPAEPIWHVSWVVSCPSDSIFLSLQGLLLFILRMSMMLMMQSEVLTISHLVMTGAGCLWSGPRYYISFFCFNQWLTIFSSTNNILNELSYSDRVNVAVIGRVPGQWQTRDPLKHCLL